MDTSVACSADKPRDRFHQSHDAVSIENYAVFWRENWRAKNVADDTAKEQTLQSTLLLMTFFPPFFPAPTTPPSPLRLQVAHAMQGD